jgi:hypothetical protein
MAKLAPPKESLKPDSPLRLSVAAAIAFPDGSMTPSGLRREAARGRLVVDASKYQHDEGTMPPRSKGTGLYKGEARSGKLAEPNGSNSAAST